MEKASKAVLNLCIILLSVAIICAGVYFVIHNSAPEEIADNSIEPTPSHITDDAEQAPKITPTPSAVPTPDGDGESNQSNTQIDNPEFDVVVDAYKVIIDGSVVGILSDEPDIDGIIAKLKSEYETKENVEDAITFVGNDITFEKIQSFAHNITDKSIIVDAVSDCLSFKIHAFRLSVDGCFLGYYETEDECNQIAAEAIAKYQRQYLSDKKVLSLDYDRSFLTEACEINKSELDTITHSDAVDMIVSDRAVEKQITVFTQDELLSIVNTKSVTSDIDMLSACIAANGYADITYSERLVSFVAVCESTVVTVLPYETTYRTNSALLHSATNVAQTGKNGKRTDVYKETYTNGVLSSKIITSTNTENPVTEIIEYGMALYVGNTVTKMTGKGFFKIPVSGFITQLYKKANHLGIDIGATKNTPVYASADGTVVGVYTLTDWYGKYIKIKHENGYTTIYAHLNGFNVSVGQTVKQGDVIGYVGMTGGATGNHLHFSILNEYDEYVNPTTILYGY